VIAGLEADHLAGERRVRDLQHLLLAWELLGDSAIDEVFAAQRDPLDGGARDPNYDRLFTRIVLAAPAPIGLGD
jgi:hypothetical protein